MCDRVLEDFLCFKMWLGWQLCPWTGGSWCGARRSGTKRGGRRQSGSEWREAWSPPWLLLQPLCPPHSLWLCLGGWTVQTNKTGNQMREIEALLSTGMICSEPSLLCVPHPAQLQRPLGFVLWTSLFLTDHNSLSAFDLWLNMCFIRWIDKDRPTTLPPMSSRKDEGKK